MRYTLEYVDLHALYRGTAASDCRAPSQHNPITMRAVLKVCAIPNVKDRHRSGQQSVSSRASHGPYPNYTCTAAAMSRVASLSHAAYCLSHNPHRVSLSPLTL